MQTDFGDSKKLVEEETVEEVEEEFNEDDERNSLFADQEEKRGKDRGSFVGTALYVSPEMLHENKFLPASDLWALGCIIYQMRVGVTPFMGSVDYEVFQKITDRQIVIPNELEPEIVDLIDRLLQLNPNDRLGAGPNGSNNDYEALKSHPYFKSINFKTLDATSAPMPADRYQNYFE